MKPRYLYLIGLLVVALVLVGCGPKYKQAGDQIYGVWSGGWNGTGFWAFEYREKDGCAFDPCGRKVCGQYGIEVHVLQNGYSYRNGLCTDKFPDAKP